MRALRWLTQLFQDDDASFAAEKLARAVEGWEEACDLGLEGRLMAAPWRHVEQCLRDYRAVRPREDGR